jgi:glutamate synthase (NADPH/NADH) small chain
VILAVGSEVPRDLPVPGRELKGTYAALEFLIPQNKEVQFNKKNPINAKGKHVIVIGGGDTGSDCVGTSNRHGAASVTQFELMPMPPEEENKALTWPYWPYKLRTSSSHDEGCSRDFAVATKALVDDGKGNVKALKAVRVEWKDGKMVEVAGSEFELPADLVFLAMGFTNPVGSLLEAFGVEKDNAAMPRQRPMAKVVMQPMSPRYLLPVTSVAVSRWWSGRFAKAVRPLAKWIIS